MSSYRKPSRIATSKPHTIANPETASLLAWLTVYPVMQNPRTCKMWLARRHCSQPELHEVYQAGFADVALALGYEHHTPLKQESTPFIVSLPVQTDIYVDDNSARNEAA